MAMLRPAIGDRRCHSRGRDMLAWVGTVTQASAKTSHGKVQLKDDTITGRRAMTLGPRCYTQRAQILSQEPATDAEAATTVLVMSATDATCCNQHPPVLEMAGMDTNVAAATSRCLRRQAWISRRAPAGAEDDTCH